MMHYDHLREAHAAMEKYQIERVNMSILHYRMESGSMNENVAGHLQADDRFQRNPLEDLKEGLDLIFELKAKIDKFHPIATETLIRLLSM